MSNNRELFKGRGKVTKGKPKKKTTNSVFDNELFPSPYLSPSLQSAFTTTASPSPSPIAHNSLSQYPFADINNEFEELGKLGEVNKYYNPNRKEPVVSYPMRGIDIKFPFKAYPSQIALMSKAVQGLIAGQHCLLESPTGTGKTLALLCATLAWQRKCYSVNAMYCPEKEKQEALVVDDKKTQLIQIGCTCHINLNKKMMQKDLEMEERKMKAIAILNAKKDNVNMKTEKVKDEDVSMTQTQDEMFLDDKTDGCHLLDKNMSCYNSMKQNKSLDDSIICLDDSFECTQISQPKSQAKSQLCCRERSTISGVSPYFKPCLNDSSMISEDDENFEGIEKTIKMEINEGILNGDLSVAESVSGFGGGVDECEYCKMKKKDKEDKEAKASISKIYYGTRTHKQINQVVKELGETFYNESAMTILSSRERTCIHPEISKAPNKNERCRDLLGGKVKIDDRYKGPDKKSNVARCAFNPDKERVNELYSAFRKNTHTSWDLEDLVKFGNNCDACPYYGIRVLHKTAKIIFCPYNYLIDPMVRDAMNIKIENSVLVFDEAHNIEDVCREAASMSISYDDLHSTERHFDDLMAHFRQFISDEVAHAVTNCRILVNQMRLWIKQTGEDMEGKRETKVNFEEKYLEFEGMEILSQFEKFGLTQTNYMDFQSYLSLFTEKDEGIDEEEGKKKKKNNDESFKINSASLTLLENLLIVYANMTAKKMKYIEDYKGVVSKKLGKTEYGNAINSATQKGKNAPWAAAQKNKKRMRINEGDDDFEEQVHLTLHLWCFNPEVAFDSLKEKAHCVIVASGTLSPFDSFRSELATDFKHLLEANHVISESQIWAGIVSRGPTGLDLNSCFKNSDSRTYQDELGKVVMQVCQTVPHGILVFFPSYSMMNKLKSRWEITGLLDQLRKYKSYFEEPRGNVGADQFDNQMKQYFSTIATGKGAILFAVCRGKISEGIDFADNQARAVITVGIPFPNYKDPQVELKQKYNDIKNKTDKKYLPGRRWYEVQAFRAINQAFGRCIRHQNDWGAIILIDSRLNNPHYQESLSKWLRKYLKSYSTFDKTCQSLSNFIATKR